MNIKRESHVNNVLSFFLRQITMALKGAVCRLLLSPQRRAIISACRAQGIASQHQWGKSNQAKTQNVVCRNSSQPSVGFF